MVRAFSIVAIIAVAATSASTAVADNNAPTIVAQPTASAVVGYDTKIIIPNPDQVGPSEEYAISGQDAVLRASIVQPDPKRPLKNFAIVRVHGVGRGASIVHVVLGKTAYEVPVIVFASLHDALAAMPQAGQSTASPLVATSATPTPGPCGMQTNAFQVSTKRLKLENQSSTTLYISPIGGTPSTKAPPAQTLSPFGQSIATTPTPTPSASPTPFPVVASNNVGVLIVPTPGAALQANGLYAATLSAQSPGDACVSVLIGSDEQDIHVHVVQRSFVLSYGVNYAIGTTVRTFTPVPVPTPFFSGSGTPPPTPMLNTIQETARTHAPINGFVMGHVKITRWEMYNLWLALGAASNSSGLIYGMSVSPGRSDTTFFTLGIQQVTTQALLPGYSVGGQIPSSITTITEDVKRPSLFVGLSIDGKALGCLVAAITNAATGATACKQP